MKFEQALEMSRRGGQMRLPVWPEGQFFYWSAESGPIVNDPLNGVRRLEFVPAQVWTSEDWEVIMPGPKKEEG